MNLFPGNLKKIKYRADKLVSNLLVDADLSEDLDTFKIINLDRTLVDFLTDCSLRVAEPFSPGCLRFTLSGGGYGYT